MIAAAPVELDAVFIITMFFNVIAGLGVFLLGMKYMSEGLQTIAGRRLRSMIGAATSNRFMGMGVGAGVTCLVQSSSVTTVMVVGFVTAGFMTLTQAIGVIMGANIGTTITGWILALKIGKYGLPIMGVAALVFRFANKDRLKFLAMAIMGMGMIFFGLELMKDGFKPIRGMEDFEAWFSTFQADTYLGVLKCAAVGCVLTMIVLTVLATITYMLSSRIAMAKHRRLYMIDYQKARYGCDSAMKYALTTIRDMSLTLTKRENEPDFSDVFAMDIGQYQQYLTEWAQIKMDLQAEGLEAGEIPEK